MKKYSYRTRSLVTGTKDNTLHLLDNPHF